MSSNCSHPFGPDAEGYCLACGLEVGADTGPAPGDPTARGAGVPRVPVSGSCAACGAERDGGRYCEACGHPDGSDPTAASPPAGWIAVVTSDVERFAASGASDQGVEFPGEHEHHVVLGMSSMRIGRRSRREPSSPDIDLTGPPTDPGVSRRHARLLWHDRGWTLIDLGSANGTYVNESAAPVSQHEPVLLAAGDRIGLGLWTRITIDHRG